MNRIKFLAKSYLWWPLLNTEIEQTAKNYQQCKLTAPNLPAAPCSLPLVGTSESLGADTCGPCTVKRMVAAHCSGCFVQVV